MPPNFIPPEEPRVGKRLRRKPQRWEGDRDQTADHHPHAAVALAAGATAAGPDDAVANDTDTTATVMSHDSRIDTPVVEDGLGNLSRAVETARAQPCARDMVDYLHSWQLRAVSQQAAQLKALHVVLKRRLRKRSGRSPEHDRLEEEALRNARRAPKFVGHDEQDGGDTAGTSGRKRRRRRDRDGGDGGDGGDGNGGDEGDGDDNNDDDDEGAQNGEHGSSSRRRETDDMREDRLNMNELVPRAVRLPLEAYLPRRVRPRYLRVSTGDLRGSIMPPSEHPGLEPTYADDGTEKWRVLPTVPASAEWNTRKSSARRPVDDVRTPIASRDEIEHA